MVKTRTAAISTASRAAFVADGDGISLDGLSRVIIFSRIRQEGREEKEEEEKRFLSAPLSAPLLPKSTAAMATEERRLEIAAEVRGVAAFHERSVSACWSSCVPKPRDSELTIGEMACIDRCVPKLVEVFELVRREVDAHRSGLPPPADAPQ